MNWFLSNSFRRWPCVSVAAALAFFVSAFSVVSETALAAPVKDRPTVYVQPDGTAVNVFVSGDEYYRYVHDASGYPLERDRDGWLVYVAERGTEPVLSDVPAGTEDPVFWGISIEPGPPLDSGSVAASIQRSRELFRRPELPFDRRLGKRVGGPYRGKVNELVIFIRFAGETEFKDSVELYDQMFNDVSTDAVSLRSYFREVSYGRMEVQAHFMPQADGAAVVSYQDKFPRRYFQPYSERNQQGYYYEQDGLFRLGEMLERAVEAITPQVPADLDLDLDDNGIAENVTFIVSGDADDWSDALWPHSYMLLGGKYINGAMLMEYNLQFRDWLTERPVGVLAHEFFHAIGSPDLYHYSHDGISPAGPWDLMEQGGEPPRHMTAWMKYNYGKFIDEIPDITEPGRYTLNPLTSNTANAFRIPVPGSKYQSFVVEYRKKSGVYESSIPDEGLLVYRVDTTCGGNADGPPDELFVMREGGEPGLEGDISVAVYSAGNGRTEFSESTIPYPFTQEGTPAGIRIYDVSAAGDTISFSVCPAIPTCAGIECGDDGCGGSCGTCEDGNDCTDDSCESGVCVNRPVQNGTACGAGFQCMSGGVCASGECIAAVPPDCIDGNECTVDTCADAGKWVLVRENRFEDVTNLGKNAGIDGDDVASKKIDIGFEFPFNGSTVNWFTAYDNGLITLGGSVRPEVTVENTEIPAQGGPANLVAPYWDDLVCRIGSKCVVAYATLGQAPDRRTIIQWNKVQKAGVPDSRMFFQIALFENGHIELRYGDMGRNNGISATVGIEGGAGAVGYQYSAFSRSITSDMTLVFAPEGFVCVNRPRNGMCLIDGQCVAKGTPDPANSCAECAPLRNGAGWTADDSNRCDDSSLCTARDYCAAGVCVGTDPVICRASDQCHLAGACDPATGTCSDPVKDDGSACNADSDGCTSGDSCRSGSCIKGNPVDCSSRDAACAVGVCVSKGPSSYRCDADKAAAEGRACGTAEGFCGGPATCDVDGRCVAQVRPDTALCRPAVGECDAEEFCNGIGSCPADSFVADGTPCGPEGTMVCVSGSCIGSPVGPTCAEPAHLDAGTPRRGTFRMADATPDATCGNSAGPDVYYSVRLAGGSRYVISVEPTGDLDVEMSFMTGCGGGGCLETVSAGGPGAAESTRFDADRERFMTIRVVKLDRSADLDFTISAVSLDDGGEDATGDASGSDSSGPYDLSGGGCGQGRTAHMPVILLLGVLASVCFAARRRVRRSL